MRGGRPACRFAHAGYRAVPPDAAQHAALRRGTLQIPGRRGNGIAGSELDIRAAFSASAPVFAEARSRTGYFQNMSDRPLQNFDLEQAIALRWALRDIVAKRLKLTPLKEDDLQTLIELGLVEIHDGSPVVTPSGLAALE